MKTCKYCKDKIKGKPKIIVKRRYMGKYLEDSFCDDRHFIKYIKKKYKLLER